MSSIRAFGLCLLTLAAVCPAQTSYVKFKLIKGGPVSNATAPSQTVLHNQAEFDAYWSKNFGSAKQPKGISWSGSELVAVHLGHRGSRAYTANIFSVSEQNGGTVVTWYERIPGAKMHPAAFDSSPYVIASIPATSSPIVFRGFVDDPSNPFSNGDAFPVRKYLSGLHSFVKDEGFEVIDRASTVKDLWLTAFGRATAPPDLDFTHWRYVAIFLGQRPTPGYNFVIQRIARIGPKEVQVIYTETQPAKGAIEPQMVTNPFVILQFPRTEDGLSAMHG